jgi:3-methyladenine DNA glycosylase AlkD
MTGKELMDALNAQADPMRAEHSQRFFKTGPGEYGEGDVFIGLTVPKIRKIAGQFKEISYDELQKVIESPIHEHRLCALVILTHKVKKDLEGAAQFYMRNLKYVNNWDLVDTSAHKVLGPYFENRDRSQLYEWAKTDHLWTQRIAVMTTFWYIRKGNFTDCLKLSDLLLNHEHDLIHKVVGWMLREIGKVDYAVEEEFLLPRYKKMPRTMLRYAIERFPEERRQEFLKGLA